LNKARLVSHAVPLWVVIIVLVSGTSAAVIAYHFITKTDISPEMPAFVEYVHWDTYTNTTSIFVKNSMSNNTKIVHLYAGTVASNLVSVADSTSLGSGLALFPQQTATIVLDWPNTLSSCWLCNKTYHFKLVPEVGTPVEFASRTPLTHPRESLVLCKQHIWHNGTSFSEAAFLVMNTGDRDLSINMISVRGQECPWSNVFYNKTEDMIDDDLPFNSTLSQGGKIWVGSTGYTFNQASESLALDRGSNMIIYIAHPNHIAVSDIGVTIGITIFTDLAQYYNECNVQAFA
jgi:hypothetical protein